MPASPTRNKHYTDLLYRRLQRKGALYRDCQRMVNQDRNVFAACMVAEGDADAHGHRRDPQLLHQPRRDPPGARSRDRARSCSALSILIARGRTVLIADTAVHELPSAEELADIAIASRRDGAPAGP